MASLCSCALGSSHRMMHTCGMPEAGPRHGPNYRAGILRRSAATAIQVRASSARTGPDLGSFLGAGLSRLQTMMTPAPPGFPLGPGGDCALRLLSDPLAFLTDVARDHGPVVGLTLAGSRVVLVSDPAAARDVLQDRSDTWVKSGTAFFPGSSLTGDGLLVSDGATWRRQRQLCTPAFRAAAVAAYAGSMARCTLRTLRELDAAVAAAGDDGAALDLYPALNRLTLDIALEALFGSALEGERAAGVTAAIQEAFDQFSARVALPLPEYLPTPGNAALARAVERLDEAVYGLIARRREYLAAEPAPPRPCLLDAMLSARAQEGDGPPAAMGDRALRDELMTLMVAGQETSAIALGWTCAQLAAHPHAQEVVAAEAIAAARHHISDSAAAPPAPGLAAAPLPRATEAALEAMRLHPPAYMVGRCAARDADLAQYRLPRGTTVLLATYLLHRDPAVWRAGRGSEAEAHTNMNAGTGGAALPPQGHGRPAAFVPGRWAEALCAAGSATALLSDQGAAGSYVPFGAGPRVCIGTGFAMLEVPLVLSMLLARFRLEPEGGARPPAARARITLRPEEVRVRLHRRADGPGVTEI
ncbi:CYP746A1 [Auxenochlorella protothecoides x Auxenochlorella symbiontica]|uniref:Cytochrome P450 n=1 Tax=Auxenochlorella protothecoides TaxID=3075 RepID=A0A1D1ZQW3_AUXPR